MEDDWWPMRCLLAILISMLFFLNSLAAEEPFSFPSQNVSCGSHVGGMEPAPAVVTSGGGPPPDRLTFSPPGNNACDHATDITTGFYQGTTCASSHDGQSSCDGTWAPSDVWYRYTAGVTPEIISLDTFGSNYDTVVSVHTGCPGRIENEIACNDDCGEAGSCLSFAAEQGRSYWIRVSGFRTEIGTYGLNVSRAGSISGRVTDAATGGGIAGARVYLYLTGGRYIKNTTTDASGAYLFPGLTPASYILRTLNDEGYVDELYDNIVCEGVGCSPGPATPVVLQQAEQRSGIHFELDRGGSITGTVTDPSGAPMSGAEVHIHDASNVHITLDITDATGSYSSFDGLSAGNYLVFALGSPDYIDELYRDVPCPSFHCNPGGGTPVPVALGQQQAGVDLALQAAGKIHGVITDSQSGNPISGVQVNVFDSAGTRITSGTTNTNGIYSQIEGLPGGLYRLLTVNGKGYLDVLYPDIPCTAGWCNLGSGVQVQVTAGQETTGIDIPLDSGGRITGQVTDSSGDPIPGVLIDLHDAINRHVHWEFTDGNGNYSSYYGLDSGSYFLRTFGYQGYMDELYDNIPCPGDTCDIMTGTPVEVLRGQTTDAINFNLEHGATIGGTITERSNQLPLANVNVGIFDTLGRFFTMGTSDSCGEYVSYNGLDGGAYLAQTSNTGNYIDEFYDDVLCLFGVCSMAAADPIAVSFGEDARSIDFELSRLLLYDNFQDGVLDWTIKSGTWAEQNGVVQGSAPPRGKARLLAPAAWPPSGVASCRFCTIEFDVQTGTAGTGTKIFVQAWYRNAANRVDLVIDTDRGVWTLKHITNGTLAGRKKALLPVDPGKAYRVQMIQENARFLVYVDGTLLLTLNYGAGIDVAEGGLRLALKNGTAIFDNFLAY